MKIALIHNLPSGGAKRHTREQIRELARRGHQIVEFTPATSDVSFAPFDPYLQARHVYAFGPQLAAPRVPLVTPYLNTWQGLRTLRGMAELSRRMACDVDAGGFDIALVKDCQLIMNPYVLGRLRATPSVFQCHHGLRHRLEHATQRRSAVGSTRVARLKAAYYAPARELFDRQFRRDELRNIRGASLVLTNSRFSQGLIRDAYGVDAEVIYPGIDTSVFTPQSVSKQPIVVCVGALIASKGHRFLVEALSRMPAAWRPGLRIVANSIVAEEERAVRALAAKRGVALQVETIHDDRRLAEVYSRASVFVYAPEQEALGMAPLEALACGTPVVAVAEGGVLETIRHGETGLLTPRDPHAFAAALGRLLADAGLRARLAQAGLAHVRRAWTWSAAVDRLEAALERRRRP